MTRSATGKPAATKKRAGAKSTARPTKRASPDDRDASPGASKNILTAGIKALTHAHEEAVARQSRVFESLLGMGKNRGAQDASESASNALSGALDPFGFKKFEDVFDQRVARAIQHLGVPSSEAVERLETEVAALRDEIARLRTQLAKR
jgi:hypothetical protein